MQSASITVVLASGFFALLSPGMTGWEEQPNEPRSLAISSGGTARRRRREDLQPVFGHADVCSHWADRDLSRVTAVQPSDSTFTCGLPRFTIGSTVKNMPAFSTAPSPLRP